MFIFILLVIIFRAIFIILHITGVGIPRRSNAEAVYYRLSETIVSDAMAIIYVCCKQGNTDVRLISSPSDMVYPTRKSNYHDHYYYYITISLQWLRIIMCSILADSIVSFLLSFSMTSLIEGQVEFLHVLLLGLPHW